MEQIDKLKVELEREIFQKNFKFSIASKEKIITFAPRYLRL